MTENPEALFGGRKSLLEVIEGIYSTVEDASLWPTLLERITAVTQSQQTLFFAPVAETPLPGSLCCSRTEPDVLPQYLDHYHSINVLAEPCDRLFSPGSVRYSHVAVPDDEFERSEFYNDFFVPSDVHYSFGLKMELGPDQVAYLSSQRSKRRGPFGPTEGTALLTLMPHLRRALRLHLMMQTLDARARGVESALERYDHAVFGLNHEGKTVFASSLAETIAQAGDGLSHRHGWLVAATPALTGRLRQMIAEVLTGTSAGGTLHIPRNSGKLPLRVSVAPFRNGGPPGSMQLAALAFVSDLSRKPASRNDALRMVYGLTPAELRVVDLLMEGLDTRTIANRLGNTLESTRFQVKRVLAKTGARRQAELVRLVLSLPGV